MSNIYDTANQLERELRESDEFKTLEEAYKKVSENEEANGLYKEFQEFQRTLQQKQADGTPFSDEDATKAQEISDKVGKNELINNLMTKEQAFSLIINDLNRIIMTPVRSLYENK